MNIPSLLIIGGFLGAGKTTVSTNLVAMLWDAGKEAALVTNDQSEGLVDTEIAAAGGIAVKEIAGGCFCCQCHQFALALDEITALRQCEIIIAEAVGSCTDLVATVVEPLRVDLQKPYKVLPMTIVVDPQRAEAALLGDGANGATLHDDVTYIFLKQLEEAQVILVNKEDSIPRERMEAIVAAIAARFHEAEVMRFSAKSPVSIAKLWEYLQTSGARHRPIQEIDYERYAKGEAFLGWLNAECRMEAGNGGIPMDEVSAAVGEEIRRRQIERAIEIAHLKVSVVDALGGVVNGGGRELSVVQCVSSAAPLDRVRSSSTTVFQGRVLINLRAQADPGLLEGDVRAAVDAVAQRWNVRMTIVRLDSFAPSAPNPPFQRRA